MEQIVSFLVSFLVSYELYFYIWIYVFLLFFIVSTFFKGFSNDVIDYKQVIQIFFWPIFIFYEIGSLVKLFLEYKRNKKIKG